MPGKIYVLAAIWILFLLLPACSAATAPAAEPTPLPTRLPLTEADVPRLSVEEARAAFDRGEAVIVDVRSPEAFAERLSARHPYAGWVSGLDRRRVPASAVIGISLN